MKKVEWVLAPAVSGIIITAVLAARSHKKACEVVSTDDSLKEKVKKTWHIYAPSVATGALTIGYMVWVVHGKNTKIAALSASLDHTTSILSRMKNTLPEEYKNAKLEEAVEKSPVTRGKEDVSYEKMPRDPETSVPCLDEWSGRLFYGSIETIRKYVNDINQKLLFGGHSFISVNEFYSLLGLDHIRAGEELGWTCENPMEVDYHGFLTDENKLVLLVSYSDSLVGV